MAAALYIEQLDDTLSHSHKISARVMIPTGEPMRSMVLLVQATCEVQNNRLRGDVVPGFGGYLERRTADEDWTTGHRRR